MGTGTRASLRAWSAIWLTDEKWWKGYLMFETAIVVSLIAIFFYLVISAYVSDYKLSKNSSNQ